MNQHRWEYHLEPAEDLTEIRLNALGSDGWELVAIHGRPGKGIFKRSGPSFAERITIAQRQQLDQTTSTGDTGAAS